MLRRYHHPGRRFFRLTWGILILAVVLYALNILLILQLIPVFEADDFWSDFINLVVAPANFIFEDLLDIESVKIIDVITWILQFFYVYIIACLLRRAMKLKIKF